MEWLTDIIKRLEVSRTLVVAVFITALIMYVGPVVSPTYVPQVPKDLVPALFGLTVLTGCLLVLWGIAEAWNLATQRIKKASQSLKNGALSEPEVAIIAVLARNPTTPFNLADIDYSKAPATKLEFHHIVSTLEEKGLVCINGFDEDLVSLTKVGREKALALHLQRKSKNEKHD